MTESNKILNSQEKTVLDLRYLYEQYGYKKYKMSKFEEYDLYLENKSFLMSDNIITFNDLNGKLMALKPDVTLSIVKNAKISELPQKLYYTENVYRVKSGQFKEIMQVGLEYLGEIDLYTICEVISLAAKSLENISQNFILDISHMGIITGVIEEASDSKQTRELLLSFIAKKDEHEILSLCEKEKIEKSSCERLLTLCRIYGSFTEMLDSAKTLVINDKTKQAFDELESLYTALKSMGYEKNINLDFSIINDLSYYNGIIFQGFIDGVSQNILSGGRYDKLLNKFSKNTNAIGFAVYLDLLEFYEKYEQEYDVDVLLIYDKNSDIGALSCAVKMFTDNGQTVRVCTSCSKNIKFKQKLKFNERGLEIIEGND